MFGFPQSASSTSSSTVPSSALPASTVCSSNTSESTTAAAAAVAALSCGISPTDPRLQPFLKLARQDHVQLHMRVLMSNGVSEVLAREQAERSTGDRTQFFGQAVLKYFASLAGNTSSSILPSTTTEMDYTLENPLASPSLQMMPETSLTSATNAAARFSNTMAFLSVRAQQLRAAQQQQQAPLSTTVSNICDTTTTGLSSGTRKDVEAAAPSTIEQVSTVNSGVAKVMANVQFNLSRTRSSRFDVPYTMPPQTPSVQLLAPMFNSATSIQGPPFPNKTSVSPNVMSWFNTSSAAQQLDKALQQWTYRVFSTHQATPDGIDAKQWRVKLSSFVNGCVTEARNIYSSGQPLPSWLTSCTVPSIVDVLTSSINTFVNNTNTLSTCSLRLPSSSATLSSSSPMVPPAPPSGNLSPVSSSESSSSDQLTRQHYQVLNAKRRKHKPNNAVEDDDAFSNSSTSSSAMSSSTSSSEPNRKERRNIKKARLCVAAAWDAATTASFNAPAVLKQRTSLKSMKGAGKKGFNANTFMNEVGGRVFSVLTSEELKRRGDRMRRFGLDESIPNGSTESRSGVSNNNNHNTLLTWQQKLALLTSTERVVGRSNALEKPYLRLCGPPDPALVRPETVLKKSCAHCLSKWNSEKNYRFIEEQFRSIRQDLTVQGIKDSFTVHVYESNARIALQNSDLGQFNQCQTQLRDLHRMVADVSIESKTEFLCYRILYLSLTNMRQDFLKLSGELSEKEYRCPPVRYAFEFRKALSEGNYHRVLRMSSSGPYLTRDLIAIFLNRLRITYLCLIAKAHYTASLTFLTKELMFHTDVECEKFLQDCDAIWVHDTTTTTKGTSLKRTAIDCRKSAPIFEASSLLQTRKVSALVGPEQTMPMYGNYTVAPQAAPMGIVNPTITPSHCIINGDGMQQQQHFIENRIAQPNEGPTPSTVQQPSTTPIYTTQYQPSAQYAKTTTTPVMTATNTIPASQPIGTQSYTVNNTTSEQYNPPSVTEQPTYTPPIAESGNIKQETHSDVNAIENAINCGRVYAPANAAFVPGHLVQKAGMVTLYDSTIVPTFESDLEFATGPRTTLLQTNEANNETNETAPREISEAKKRHSHQGKKKTCC